jgi:hypothetical protein
MDKDLLAILENQNAILKQLADNQGLLTKAPASRQTATELHGNGSLWGSFPIERDVISAHIAPHGLAERLVHLPSVTENPLYATLTGYTATVGSEPVNPCDDAPAGYVKGCNITAPFGRVMRDTQTIEIDKVMLKANRGDFQDLVLRGQVLNLQSAFNPTGLNDADILNIITKSEMVIVGVNVDRTLARHVWQGNPANNTAGGGYKEFRGLDLQIATNHRDAHTGAICTALDSDVKDFAFDLITGTGRSIVEYMSMVAFYLDQVAVGSGLDPVNWVVVMRADLWQELSAVWPCQYNTNKCSTTASLAVPGAVVMIDGRENITDRDAFRTGMYLPINGRNYPVILDDGIFEYTNTTSSSVPSGQFASSIYFVPLTMTGNFPITYMEYLDYRQAGSDVSLLAGKQPFWTDGGEFYWAIDPANFCFKLKAKTERRMTLRAPQLAGRIDRVRYAPLQHLRSGFPDSGYFKDGGVSLRADTSYYY